MSYEENGGQIIVCSTELSNALTFHDRAMAF